MLSEMVKEFHEREAAMLEAQAAMNRGTRDALQAIAATWLTKFWGADAWREILLMGPQYQIDIEARTVSVLLPFDWSALAPCVFHFWMKSSTVHQVQLSEVTSDIGKERLILVSPKPDDSPEMYRTQFLRELTADLGKRRQQFEERNEKRRREAVHRATPSLYGLGTLDGGTFKQAIEAMRAAGATDAEVEETARSWNAACAKVAEEKRQAQERESAQAAARRDVLDWLDRVRPVAREAANIFDVYYRSAVPVKFAVVNLDYAVVSDSGVEVQHCRALVPDDGDLSGDTFLVSGWLGWEKKTFRHLVAVSAPVLVDGKEQDRPDAFYPYEDGIVSSFPVPVVRNQLLELHKPFAWRDVKELMEDLAWPQLSEGFERKYSPYFGDLRGFVNGLIHTWGTEQQQ